MLEGQRARAAAEPDAPVDEVRAVEVGARIDRPRTLLELANEAIMQAAKPRFFRLLQIEVGKQAP